MASEQGTSSVTDNANQLNALRDEWHPVYNCQKQCSPSDHESRCDAAFCGFARVRLGGGL